MNARFRNIVRDYLTFSARERTGLILLFVLGLGIYLFSRYYTFTKPSIDKTAFQQELAGLTITIDSSKSSAGYARNDNNDDYYRPKRYENYGPLKGELFAFDPNTLNADGWKRLGVREKTAATIQKFVAKGFKFRQPEDLLKIYGLRKEDAERLIPYVHIEAKETFSRAAFSNEANNSYPKPTINEKVRNTIIDINSADSSAFISLPGIGTKLALRIINFREKLGGFASVDQLAETYGVSDSTFQLIKPRLQCNKALLKTININTADVNLLRTHPYIKWNIANAIVNFRTQHGNFASVDDVRKINIITDEMFNKMAPYLTL